MGEMDTVQRIGKSNYGFSAAKLSSLGASEYTLVTIAVDESGSVDSFKTGIENCLKEVVKACRKSPRADNLLLRILAFSTKLREIHGFKLLQDCNPDDYTDCIKIDGITALFDASVNSLDAARKYGETLFGQDYTLNAIFIAITDGADNAHSLTARDVGDSIQNMIKDETFESLVSILVGVNVISPDVKKLLKEFKDVAKFTQYEELDNASEKTLARLANFVSKSISSQSQSLGSGGASQPITF